MTDIIIPRDCKECGNEVYWYPATNEDGWKCCACDYKPGEPPGFDPHRDRADIWRKVHAILLDMAGAKLIHVSNSSAGDAITDAVADQCRISGHYDQYSIIRNIMIVMGGSHAHYWKWVSDGVVAGKDPRERCHCGALAKAFGGGEKTCTKHMGPF